MLSLGSVEEEAVEACADRKNLEDSDSHKILSGQEESECSRGILSSHAASESSLTANFEFINLDELGNETHD